MKILRSNFYWAFILIPFLFLSCSSNPSPHTSQQVANEVNTIEVEKPSCTPETCKKKTVRGTGWVVKLPSEDWEERRDLLTNAMEGVESVFSFENENTFVLTTISIFNNNECIWAFGKRMADVLLASNEDIIIVNAKRISLKGQPMLVVIFSDGSNIVGVQITTKSDDNEQGYLLRCVGTIGENSDNALNACSDFVNNLTFE